MTDIHPRVALTFRRILPGALALAFAFLVPSAVLADVVHLKNGKTLEGRVEKAGGKVIVHTKFGKNEFDESEVARIEEKSSPKEEFEKRRAAIKGDDVDALMSLYAWAKGENLKTQSTGVLRDILKIDPDNEAARKLLGYVNVDGEWVTEKEAEKLAADAEAKKMRAKGLVEYKGEWMTPEEKEVKEHEAKGEVLVDGEWVNKRDMERAEKAAALKKEMEEHRAKGEFLVGDKWLPRAEAEAAFRSLETPYIAEGEAVQLLTNKGIDFGDKMVVTADAAFRACNQLFGKKPEGAEKIKVFVGASTDDYNELGGNVFNADQKSSNYDVFCTGWLPQNPQNLDMVSVTWAHEQDSATELWVRHAVGEQYVNRLLGPNAADVPPRWFVDGVANYVELWWNSKFYNWATGRVQQNGGLLPLKSFFGSYPVTRQSILQAGRVIHFLKDPNCPEEIQKAFSDAIIAVNDGKKISKAFRTLEKAMVKEEDSFQDAAGG